MSTPVNPAIAGTLNSTCFGIGKPFGNVITPAYITASVQDIQEGTAWNPGQGELGNRSYKLLQNSAELWVATLDNYELRLTWSPTNTLISLAWTGIFQFFFNELLTCQLTVDNEKVDPAANFFGGTVQLFL